MTFRSLSHRRDAIVAILTTAILASVLGTGSCSMDLQDPLDVEGPADPGTPGASLISDLRPSSYDTARLREGGRYYLHREPTITSLAPSYATWLWIRTANADRTASTDSFISYELMEHAVVAVAYDRRAAPLPDWLAGWGEAPSGIAVTDAAASPRRVLYEPRGPARVVLGGNMAAGATGARSMHLPLLLRQSSREPTILELDPLASDEKVQFSAVHDQVGEPVAGHVDWTATGGAITSNGLYTAGQTPGDYTVTVIDASTGVSASASVTIKDPGGGGTRIAGVSWACNDLITDAPGSDLWPITWSDDGHQYTAWGDGNGFQGNTKRTWGIARLEGDAPNYQATDLAEGPEGSDQGKIGSIISVGGTLYAQFSKQDVAVPNQSLRKSTDKGVTLGGDLFTWPDKDVLKFVQHGPDNAHGGGFVYATASVWEGVDPVYLVRVPEGQIETRSAWEWFTGTPSNPSWGGRANRTAVFSDPLTTATFSATEAIVTYFPDLTQYILTHHRGANMGEWAFYVSPHVYGPWTLIERYGSGNFWCGVNDAVVVLSKFIAPKWIEPITGSAIDFWMMWSGTGQWDRFNLVEATFQLQ